MDPQAYGNIAGVLLGTGYATFRLIKMFKDKKSVVLPPPPPPGGSCPDAGCHGQVGQNKVDIDEVKVDLTKFKEDIYPTITQTGKDVEYIKGWIERGEANK